MTETSIPTIARNATVTDLVEMLRRQHDLQFDAVVPSGAIRSKAGMIHVGGLDAIDITKELAFRPTEMFDGHLAEKLGIPVRYLRTLRKERLDLFDANVNGWLHGGAAPGTDDEVYPPDSRLHMLRTFREPGSDEPGIARALLSNSYLPVDNLDIVMSVLQGITAAGINAKVVSANLSERRMWVKVSAPEVRVNAENILQKYRSPFSREQWLQWAERHGIEDADPDLPIVFAGLVFGNSETGDGVLFLEPQVEILSCLNGQTSHRDAYRKVHLGARLEEGVIRYSDETRRANIELIRNEAADVVRTFLSTDFLQKKVDEITETGNREVRNPVETVKLVASKLAYTQEEQNAILDNFLRGGLPTAFGVAQAVTALAQQTEDPDTAYDLEGSAWAAMEAAAALS